MSKFFVILLLNVPKKRWRQIASRLRERAKVTTCVDSGSGIPKRKITKTAVNRP